MSLSVQVLSFVSEHIQAGEARLAGNSVHVDAAFLRRLMPKLHGHLHHRIVDVSTVAELCSRWYPMDAKKMPRKKVPTFLQTRGNTAAVLCSKYMHMPKNQLCPLPSCLHSFGLI